MASSGLTTLQAVNQILEGINEFPFAALDTGGTSVASQAENVLDRVDKQIQAKGWHENTEYNVTLSPADVTKLDFTDITAATFTLATKNLEDTNPTGSWPSASYSWVYDDQIYISGGTEVTAGWYEIASWTDADNIVLKEDITTDASDPTDVTVTLIGWENAIALTDDILTIDTYGGSIATDVAKRNGKLYDLENNTYTFSGDLKVKLVRKLNFVDLTAALKAYIAAQAAMEFAQSQTEGQLANAFLGNRRDDALLEAHKMNAANSQANIFNTAMARRIHGRSGVSDAMR